MLRFQNRKDAGIKLSEELQEYKDKKEDTIVLALPRGGVPVAYQVADKLNLPLDIFLVRKLGTPGHEELAMGAIASGGIRVLNEDVVGSLNITEDDIARTAAAEQQELERRESEYRKERKPLTVNAKNVILVDDGLATGASMRAAVSALKTLNPKKIIIAVPAAPPSTCNEFKEEVDDVICVITPESFRGVGEWYEDFSQTTDEEVIELLNEN